MLQPSVESTLSVETVDRIQPQEFARSFIRRNKPVLMTGMMNEWPAMQTWSFEFLYRLGSKESVLLEEGNVMQDDTSFRKQSFQDYLRQLIEETEQGDNKPYLSVFKIFERFPHLKNDVDFSIINQHKLKASTVGWIGPAGTVTGYHIDWGDNILAQICGRKCIHLAAPEESDNMYVSPKFDQGTTISSVDLQCVDHEKFPRFKNVKHHRIELHPGQMLFIPRGWWHDVRSLDKSISVSNITYDLKGIVRDVAPHRIKQQLHNVGLWKCDCTCHVVRGGKWVRK